MTDLEKYEAVNKCETLDQLAHVVLSFADEEGMIQGRTNRFSALRMADACLHYENRPKNSLTREFGIRQQAMYLIYYSRWGA
jgi:hypothetical protein